MPGGNEQRRFPRLHAFARAELDAVLMEPFPDEWKELLRQIDERDRNQSSRTDPVTDPVSGDVHHDQKSRD